MKVYEITVENAYIFYSYSQEIDLESAILQVSDYRRNKVEKIRNIEDKKLSVMLDLLLMHGLDKLEIPYSKPIRFMQNEYGKPYIEDLNDWRFNFSHSGDIAVCAISKSQVGIDVELVSRDCSSIVHKYFTESETELAKTYGTSYIWTRKEAVAKANGRGIGVGIDKTDTSGNIIILDGEEYRVITNRVERYYISLAYRLAFP